MVLKRIFGPKREEVAGGWRRMHNEELCNLYASPNIILVIKLRRMRWEGDVAFFCWLKGVRRERGGRNIYKVITVQ
jgi:hypothetical protein